MNAPPVPHPSHAFTPPETQAVCRAIFERRDMRRFAPACGEVQPGAGR